MPRLRLLRAMSSDLMLLRTPISSSLAVRRVSSLWRDFRIAEHSRAFASQSDSGRSLAHVSRTVTSRLHSADELQRKPSSENTRHNRSFSSDLNGQDSGDHQFYADEGLTWQSLGLHLPVARAMEACGLERPSAIQAAALPTLLAGRNAVIAAETGCGKTHAYLTAIAHHHLNGYEDVTAGDRWQHRRRGDGGGDRGGGHRFSLVLCPNAALCRQVMGMALQLRGGEGGGEEGDGEEEGMRGNARASRPLLSVEAVVGGEVRGEGDWARGRERERDACNAQLMAHFLVAATCCDVLCCAVLC